MKRTQTEVVLSIILLSLFCVFSFSATAGAASNKVSGGKCALCHTPLITKFASLPHGGGGSRYAETADAAGKTSPKPLTCTDCHETTLVKGKPVVPANSPNVCGKCHLKGDKRGAVVINADDWNSSKHAKAGLNCLSCHKLHQPVDQPLLKDTADGVCVSCHSKQDSHQLLTVKVEANKGNCLSCHDPHGGKEGGLYAAKVGGEDWQLKKTHTHKPVAEGKCKDCHDVHKALPVTGGAKVTQPDDEDDEDTGPGPSRSAGPNRSLLAKPPATICYQCHGDKQAAFATSKHGKIGDMVEPKKDNSCAACHLPHGSDYSYLTLYEGSRLCLTCHPSKTPHHFLASASVKQRKLECTKCHNPHGSPYSSFLVRDKANICAMCHKK